MRRLIYFLAAAIAMVACGPDDQPQVETIPLSIDVKSLDFAAEGGEKTFTATASEQLYLVPGDSWVKASKGTKGSDNKTVVTVTVAANDSEQERSTQLSVVAGDRGGLKILSPSKKSRFKPLFTPVRLFFRDCGITMSRLINNK